MRYPLANAQGFSCYVEAYNDIDVAHWTKNIYTCRDQYIDIKLSHLHLCTLIPSSVGLPVGSDVIERCGTCRYTLSLDILMLCFVHDRPSARPNALGAISCVASGATLAALLSALGPEFTPVPLLQYVYVHESYVISAVVG